MHAHSTHTRTKWEMHISTKGKKSRRAWGTWCPKVWKTGIIYLISCGISGRNIFLSVQFRVITSLCNIWCWTFIKFYLTGSKIQKYMQYPTVQSDRNGHGQQYVYTHIQTTDPGSWVQRCEWVISLLSGEHLYEAPETMGGSDVFWD